MNLKMKSASTGLAFVAALSLAAIAPQNVRAQESNSDLSASSLPPELQAYLRYDVARIRNEIAVKQKSVEEFKKLVRKAKIARVGSIVVNTLQVAGAVLVTHQVLKNFAPTQTGTLFTVAPSAAAIGEAIYSVSIKFRDVERTELLLAEATKQLERDALEANALEESFSRLGPEGMTYLRALALNRAMQIQQSMGKLEEMNTELEAARRHMNRTKTIKIVGQIGAVLSAVGSVSSLVAARANKSYSVQWYAVSALAAGGSYTIFDFVGKYAGLAESEYKALKRRVDTLVKEMSAEETSQKELARLLGAAAAQ